MRTAEQLQRRRTRRKVARFVAANPPPARSADPLHNAVVYLASLRCDNTQTRQDVLSK